MGRTWLTIWFPHEKWAAPVSYLLTALLLAYISTELRSLDMVIWSGVAFVCSLLTGGIIEVRDQLRDRQVISSRIEQDYKLGRVKDYLEE